MLKKKFQLHMRLSDEDNAALDALISMLNRQHAVPGRPYTRTDAMRFALHTVSEQLVAACAPGGPGGTLEDRKGRTAGGRQ